MTIMKNIKSTELRIWLFFFFYAAIVAVMVQFVIIPYVFPTLNEEFGMLKGLDTSTFHNRAVNLAVKIKKEGWSAWELRPSEYHEGMAGLLAVLYYLIIPRPWVLIPFNAMAHAFSGLIIYSIIFRLVGNVRAAFLSALPFIVFPSSMLWYTQIHKDGFSIFGFYLVLYSWVLFLDINTWKNTGQIIMAVIYSFIGMLTLWVVRPYISQMILSLLFFVMPLIIIRQIVWWRRSFLSFSQMTVAITVTCCVTGILIPFSRAGIEEAVISVTAPQEQVKVKEAPDLINKNAFAKYLDKTVFAKDIAKTRIITDKCAYLNCDTYKRDKLAAKEETVTAKRESKEETVTAKSESVINKCMQCEETPLTSKQKTQTQTTQRIIDSAAIINRMAENIENIYSQRVERLKNKAVKALLDRRALNVIDKLKSGRIDTEVLTVLRSPLNANMSVEAVRELKMTQREYMNNEYGIDTKRPLADILNTNKEGRDLVKAFKFDSKNKAIDMLKVPFEAYLDNHVLDILNKFPEGDIKNEYNDILSGQPFAYYLKNDTSLYIDMFSVNLKENKTVEIKSKPLQKHIADQISNILESPLGSLSNINQIRVFSDWKRTPWIPVYIDGKLATIANRRWGYLGTGGLTNIDIDIAFAGAVDVIKYLPRALLIAFMAPFPNTWSMETTYMAGNMMRMASVGEMIVIYCALLFLPYALYRWRKNIDMWLIAYLSTSILIVLSLGVCNVGTLYRMRYGFLMIMVALGIAGLGAMILGIRGRKVL